MTEEQAIRGAIGEAIERYCASHIDHSALVISPWQPIADRAVAPPEFVLYSVSQYEAASSHIIAGIRRTKLHGSPHASFHQIAM